MNTAIILAGGNGSRMGSGDVPKQYISVMQKPIISYCLSIFEMHDKIDAIIIVAEEGWRSFLNEWIQKGSIRKFKGYAEPGRTRQHSIYHGLKEAVKIAGEDDIVIIHDAARPLVSEKIITRCMDATLRSDGAMPVITVKDTVYLSQDARHIEGLLDRDKLFAGQAPESFRLGKYYQAHLKLSDEEMGNVRGSSELAYKSGMSVELVEGSEDNFKITTQDDLRKFKLLMEEQAALPG